MKTDLVARVVVPHLFVVNWEGCLRAPENSVCSYRIEVAVAFT